MHSDRFYISTQKCHRCGHEWFLRKPQLPSVCPNCKSPYWKTGSEYKQELDLEVQNAESIKEDLSTILRDLGKNPEQWSEIIKIGWQRMFYTSDFPIKNLQPILAEGFSIDKWFIVIPQISSGLVEDIANKFQRSGTTKKQKLNESEKRVRKAMEWETVLDNLKPDLIKILAILWYADGYAATMRYPEAEAIIQKKAWLLLREKLQIKEEEAISILEQSVTQLDEKSKGATCWAEVIRVP